MAIPLSLSQPLKPALVHCLGVARGYCKAELSPALPGTPQRALYPKGERKLSGLKLRLRGRGAASLLSWNWSLPTIPVAPNSGLIPPTPALLGKAQLQAEGAKGNRGVLPPRCPSHLQPECPPILHHLVPPRLPPPIHSIHWQVCPSPLGPRLWCGSLSGIRGSQVSCIEPWAVSPGGSTPSGVCLSVPELPDLAVAGGMELPAGS